MQLLIIPLVLAGGGWWLSQAQRKVERSISIYTQRHNDFQAYIDSISELLLRGNLRSSKKNAEERTIAYVRTLTILPRLDGQQKGELLIFLKQARLIKKKNPIVSLTGADLIWVKLPKADMSGVNLSGANLYEADFSGADLTGSDLKEANLKRAVLVNAKVTDSQLRQAKSLEGTVMPDMKVTLLRRFF